MAATAVLGGAASGLVVFGAQIGDTINGRFFIGGAVFTAAWTAARWVVAIAFISILFAVFYSVAPNQDTTGCPPTLGAGSSALPTDPTSRSDGADLTFNPA